MEEKTKSAYYDAIARRIESMEASYGPKETYDMCILLAIYHLYRSKNEYLNQRIRLEDLDMSAEYLSLASDITERHKDMLSEEDVSIYGIIQTIINKTMDKMNQDSVAKYCDNDVLATEAAFNTIQGSDA